MVIQKNNKEKIITFLIKHKGKKYSMRKLHKSLKISYPTVQRYVEVLNAEKRIKIEDLGNTKLVFV